MKKSTKLLVALSTALLVGGGVLLAQDADEVKPEWKVSGHLGTGLVANFDTPYLKWAGPDYGNRLRLNLNWSYGNIGVRSRVQFSGSSYNTTFTTKVDGTNATTKSTNGFIDPKLIYAFGYANLFDDKLEIQAGRLFTNDFGANNLGYGMYGDGVSAVVKPINGLSVGAKVYVSNSGEDTISPETFFYTNALYGVAYEQDLFSVAVGYGREASSGTGDSLISGITVSPIDQLSILWENDVFHLFGFEGKTQELLSNLVVDIAPIDPLTIDLGGTADIQFATDIAYSVWIEGFVSYDINDNFTCDIGGGYTFGNDAGEAGVDGGINENSWWIRPGVSYHINKNADIGLHYAYASGSGGYYLTSVTNTGNEVQLEFQWRF